MFRVSKPNWNRDRLVRFLSLSSVLSWRLGKEQKRGDEISLISLSLSLFLSLAEDGKAQQQRISCTQYYYYCYCFPLRPLLRRVFHLFHASKHVTLVISTISARVRSRRLFYSISKTDEQLSHNITQGRTPDILSRVCTLASFLYERDLFVPKKRRS